MPHCESCGRPFTIISAKDHTTRHFIMLIWALRKTNCRVCLETMQAEWREVQWAASLGIPTVKEVTL
jgi:hypothetical protein